MAPFPIVSTTITPDGPPGSSLTLRPAAVSLPFPLSLRDVFRTADETDSGSSVIGTREFERESSASLESTCMASWSGSERRFDDEATASAGAVRVGGTMIEAMLRAVTRCALDEAALRVVARIW